MSPTPEQQDRVQIDAAFEGEPMPAGHLELDQRRAASQRPARARPHLLAQEIVDDLRSALAQVEDVLGELEQRAPATKRDR